MSIDALMFASFLVAITAGYGWYFVATEFEQPKLFRRVIIGVESLFVGAAMFAISGTALEMVFK